jgi:isocitrate lyase
VTVYLEPCFTEVFNHPRKQSIGCSRDRDSGVAAIADAVSVPIIVDADTGYGNAVNMVRTVRAFERAGAAGIQIEDQVFPKKCDIGPRRSVSEAACR